MKDAKLTEEEKDGKNREVFFENLKGALEVEPHLGLCCQRIGLLIKNGGVRTKCERLALSAKEAEGKLQGIFQREGVVFKIEHRCQFCRLKPDNFSLEGAINLGLEIVKVGIQYYRNLVRLSRGDDRSLFVGLLKDKLRHRRMLLVEQGFERTWRKGGVIDDFCLPRIISQLWR